jgi:hypothetical protein
MGTLTVGSPVGAPVGSPEIKREGSWGTVGSPVICENIVYESEMPVADIEIMAGKQFTICDNLPRIKTKAIVFDLDETIGHFSNLRQIHIAVEEVLERSITQSEFNQLLNLYPEFLRPGILTILEFLEYKKAQGTLQKVFLYTNNQCGKEWVDWITEYIDNKIGANRGLFDDTIYAFKIKNRIVDFRRTTNSKTHDDFIKCTMLKDATTELCFVDDNKYLRMCNDNVYYIKPRPYVHSMTQHEIVERFVDNMPAFIGDGSTESYYLMRASLQKHCSGFVGGSSHKLMSDIEITKKIMYHVREYLYFNGQRPLATMIAKGRTYKNRNVLPHRNKTLKKNSKHQ